MSEENQTITFKQYLEQYTGLEESTIKTYIRAHKNNNPDQYVDAKKAVKNLYKFYINFIGNSNELESKLRRAQESNEALVQNMNELLRHCAELKEENESLNSIKLASSVKIQELMQQNERLLDSVSDKMLERDEAHEALERANYTNQDLRNELKSYVEEECQYTKKLEAENKELKMENESLFSVKLEKEAKIKHFMQVEDRLLDENIELKEQVQVLETVKLANFGRIDELTKELDMLRQGITVLSTEDCNPNHIIALGELDTHVALLQQELEDKEAEFEKAFEEQEQRFEKTLSTTNELNRDLFNELETYKGEAYIHRKLKETLINQDHENQTNKGDNMNINTDKILDERTTRQKIKEQGKAKTRAELKESGIKLENIAPRPEAQIVDRRMILITWLSFMQTVIREDDRALEYLIENFDSIESICYVNFETV